MRRIFAPIAPWLDAALSFLYPEVCQVCHNARATPDEGYICTTCASDVRFIDRPFCETCGRPIQAETDVIFSCTNCRGTQPGFAFARSAAIADGTLLKAIHGFKYNNHRWFEPFLSKVLLQQALPALQADPWDLVLPVPLHWRKHRQRGFNQAERLARYLAKALGIPCKTTLVKRVANTRTQTLLDREERLENVRGAFRASKSTELQAANIILVDDVFTTGATTSACSKALLKAGAAKVCVWTLARGK